MMEQTNYVIDGLHGKPILIDVSSPGTNSKSPVVIFAHGFKGFKDFGAFNLVAQHFAAAGFTFVKFNFSHNGTSVENPLEFVDLEAFGENNFCKELDDLGAVIDWLFNTSALEQLNMDLTNLHLIGHSRGGGIVLLKAFEEERITKLCTWASVSDYGKKWTDSVVEYWKKEGVIKVINGRTKQEMPLNFQLCDNYFNNLNRLHIPDLAKKIKQQTLIVHGTNDEAVTYNVAEQLHSWIENSELFSIENGNHTFDTKHPWTANKLPTDMLAVVEQTIQFFKN